MTNETNRDHTPRVLVAYASQYGSTAAIAEAIAEVIRTAGAVVDVRHVVDVATIESYDAAIVGSAIYNGAWLPEAAHFIRYHAARLSQIPVAYFALSSTMREDTPEHRQTVRSFLDPVLQSVPQVQPIAIGLFSGSIDPRKIPPLIRLRMRFTSNLRKGDHRRWDEIRAWAANVTPRLLTGTHTTTH